MHITTTFKRLLVIATVAFAGAAMPASAADGTFLRFSTDVKAGGKSLTSPMMIVRTGSRAAINGASNDKALASGVVVAIDGASLSGNQVSFTATVTLNAEDGKATREESFKFKATLDQPTTQTSKSSGDAISLTIKASRPSAEQLKLLGVQ
jgi:hypothetical protein